MENITPLINKQQIKTKPLLAPGHRACAGCGQMIAARSVLEALGPNTIIANATGCLEVTTSPYPESAWGVPWIHSLFENASAIASGINAALNYKKKTLPFSKGRVGDVSPKILAQGGDGSTFDIGFGLISGMWARKESIIYVCYDNEAYANTGMQASGATPFGSNTSTTPSGRLDITGSHQSKKDMIAIALAHGLPYVAQTTAGYIADIQAKVKKAAEIDGPSYIQILVPCIPGWKIRPDQAIESGRLAVQTGLYPSLEYTNGVLTGKMKIAEKVPVENYLKLQGRFSHLFKNEDGKKQIAEIQKIADANIEKYKLLG